jgi:phosphate starvation-inducible protein PhoH and related proteins
MMRCKTCCRRMKFRNTRSGARLKLRRWPTCAGGTLNNAFIILDEAQNSTTEQMLMFLTRLGHGSKAVITGDETQIDLPPHKHSGLLEAHRVLGHVEGIAVIEFGKRDVVRHALVQRIISAYEEHRGKGQPE